MKLVEPKLKWMHFPGAAGIGGGSFCSACRRGGGGSLIYPPKKQTNKQTNILAFRMIAINTTHVRLRRQQVLASCAKKPYPLSICTWFLLFFSLKYPVWWISNWNFTGYSKQKNLVQTKTLFFLQNPYFRKKIQFIKLDISNWRIAKIKCT